ncbi:MAG: glycosyltransferase family 39 protein [Bacteroidota bacterium]
MPNSSTTIDVEGFLQRFQSQEKWHLAWVIGVALFLSLWRLGSHSVYEWDESRYGEIAFWMNKTGDYITYLYAGQLDTWNAKPPLGVWLIASSYKILGLNEWALRVPSALATVGFFTLFFRFICLYRQSSFAFLCCMILMTCKGIIGHHVGRTGDTDSILLCCLMGFVYAMALYLDKNKPGAIIWAGLCLGLAFYAKGTAFVLYLPALFFYSLFRGKALRIIGDYRAWISMILVLGVIFSWRVLVTQYGQEFETATHMGKNSWEVLIYYDTFHRFFTPGVEGNSSTTADYAFFFSALDVKFNLWNYVFYLGIAAGMALLWKHKHRFRHLLAEDQNRLLLISTLLVVTQGIILTVSQSKLVWYITPLLPFAAIWAGWFVAFSSKKKTWMVYIWVLLWLLTFGRQFYYLHQVEEDRGHFLRNNKDKIVAADKLWIYNSLHQDIRLYADWYNAEVYYLAEWEGWEDALVSDQILLANLTDHQLNALGEVKGIEYVSFENFHLIWKREVPK